MKILFAAGGSGGHITPALAVADVIQKKSKHTEIVFVSSNAALDDEIFSAHSQKYRRHTLSPAKFRRYFSPQNILDIFRAPRVFREAWKILRKEKPDLVFSKGGFVGFPIGMVAKILRIPVIIHESDIASGLANRMLRKISKKILTSFPTGEGEWVGTPIREEILNGDAKRGREFLGFPEKEKILLVIGGSQGAEIINQLLLFSLDELLKKACVVHISGRGKSARKDTNRYRSFPYLGSEYGDVLAAADLAISRAGANSLFEFAAQKKAILLLPLLSAANNHQKKNAEFFASRGAAKILYEDHLSSGEFQKTVSAFLEDETTRKNLEKNIATLAQNGASQRIAELLILTAKEVAERISL
ncbi:UDP-N-acetylglucosamine--N-acetylmuramyl-(pentapeptide) pyrophosphoryl-undecaprenol N-acetylglucosamine transferase [Candidatus Peregrinibacteria bacterium]|nr:UDP-N-acetylglucosamine--N-acetylmuramyl-(pentapeptide) pyrophosphoryl-undecaprenol N-acetylglucosamine transferase [Candidatus Peregrinibacteria bacterium]